MLLSIQKILRSTLLNRMNLKTGHLCGHTIPENAEQVCVKTIQEIKTTGAAQLCSVTEHKYYSAACTYCHKAAGAEYVCNMRLQDGHVQPGTSDHSHVPFRSSVRTLQKPSVSVRPQQRTTLLRERLILSRFEASCQKDRVVTKVYIITNGRKRQ